jgi:hypothetical protein
MLEQLDAHTANFNSPREIEARLFTGKFPKDVSTFTGPVVQLGDYTPEQIDTSKHHVLMPLTGRQVAICLLNGKSCIAANVLPGVSDEHFCSSREIAATLRSFVTERTEIFVFLGSEPDPVVNRAIAQALVAMGVKPQRYSVWKASCSPADHPVIHDGSFSVVDARLVVSMLKHQNQDPRPIWAPVAMR